MPALVSDIHYRDKDTEDRVRLAAGTIVRSGKSND
jgi:hypothetical protein